MSEDNNWLASHTLHCTTFKGVDRVCLRTRLQGAANGQHTRTPERFLLRGRPPLHSLYMIAAAAKPAGWLAHALYDSTRLDRFEALFESSCYSRQGRGGAWIDDQSQVAESLSPSHRSWLCCLKGPDRTGVPRKAERGGKGQRKTHTFSPLRSSSSSSSPRHSGEGFLFSPRGSCGSS